MHLENCRMNTRKSIGHLENCRMNTRKSIGHLGKNRGALIKQARIKISLYIPVVWCVIVALRLSNLFGIVFAQNFDFVNETIPIRNVF